jgi:uncharacterized repeat protein (TIGR01451 family)
VASALSSRAAEGQVTISYALPATLAITNSGSPNPVPTRQRLTYTIRVANPSGLAATSVAMSDALPTSVKLNSVSTTQGTCTTTGGGNKGVTASCDLGSLAGGANATIMLVVTTSKAGTLSDTATVTAANIPGSASATAITTVTGS